MYRNTYGMFNAFISLHGSAGIYRYVAGSTIGMGELANYFTHTSLAATSVYTLPIIRFGGIFFAFFLSVSSAVY